MSLSTNLSNLTTRIATECKALRSLVNGNAGDLSGLATSTVSIGLLCTSDPGGGCGNGSTVVRAWAALYGATVTIDDPSAPSVSAPCSTAADALIASSTSAPSWRAGVLAAPLNQPAAAGVVQAADVGGGVAKVELLVDGQVAHTLLGQCDFTRARPCSAPSNPLTLDTSTVPNGEHEIRVRVTDAAANVTTTPVLARVHTAGRPPAAPSALQVTSPAALRPGGTIATTWIAGGDPSATTHYRLRRPARTLDAATAVEGTGLQLALPATPGAFELSVWHENAAGASASAAIPISTLPPAAVPGASASSPDPLTGAFRASWALPTQPAGAARLVGVRWSLCPPAGAGCDGGVAAAPALDLTAPSAGTWTLTLAALDEAGQAGPEAVLPVTRAALGGSGAGPVPPPAPAVVTAPALHGPARAGARRWCRPGGWTGAASQAYAWLAGGVPLPRQFGPSLPVTPALAGRAVSCRVTATGPGGVTVATSRAVTVERLSGVLRLARARMLRPGLLELTGRVLAPGVLHVRVGVGARPPVRVRRPGAFRVLLPVDRRARLGSGGRPVVTLRHPGTTRFAPGVLRVRLRLD